MTDTKAIEFAADQVELWLANTYDPYMLVRQWNAWGWTYREITEQLVGIISRREHDSAWLWVSDTAGQAAFGDKDDVTPNDITPQQWREIIASVCAE